MDQLLNYNEIDSLAPLPRTLAFLAKVQYEPEIWLGDVTRVIEMDQAMTANIIKVANSPALNPDHTHIITVKDALMRIGMTNVLNMALIMSLSASTVRHEIAAEMAENALARHSMATYISASVIVKNSSRELPRSAATAGLLHDIGKLILERYFGRAVRQEIFQMMRERKIPELEAEQSLLGTDHTRVGEEMALQWGFPNELIQVIGHHHDVDTDPNDSLMETVKAANFLSKNIFPVYSGLENGENDECIERLGIDKEKILNIKAKIESEYKKISSEIEA